MSFCKKTCNEKSGVYYPAAVTVKKDGLHAAGKKRAYLCILFPSRRYFLQKKRFLRRLLGINPYLCGVFYKYKNQTRR